MQTSVGIGDRRTRSRAITSTCAAWLPLTLLVAAGPARAADLAPATSLMSPPPVAAAHTWSGFYVGANVGYGLDHFAFPYNVNPPGGPSSGRLLGFSGINSNGPLGGIQAGFNYQFRRVTVVGFPLSIVAGVEVDNDGSGISGHQTVYGELPGGASGSATFGTKFEDFGTARFRVGPSFGRFWPYFTAGLSYGSINTSYAVSTTAPFATAGSSTTTRSGIFPHVGAVGIGLEYAFSDRWSAKVEYLYDFINAHDVNIESNGASGKFFTRTMYHVARVGLNYKIDVLPTAAPVVAKY